MDEKIIKYFRIVKYTNIAILVLSLALKVIIWRKPNLINEDIIGINTCILYITGFVFSIYYLIAIFEPLQQDPDWTILYPPGHRPKREK